MATLCLTDKLSILWNLFGAHAPGPGIADGEVTPHLNSDSWCRGASIFYAMITTPSDSTPYERSKSTHPNVVLTQHA